MITTDISIQHSATYPSHIVLPLAPARMVVVIVGRELLVTALRSFLEDRGSDFSAKMSGKLKMVLQSGQ